MAKEEARVRKEEERVAMENSLWKAEGSSKRKTPQRQLFLLSLESTGNLEEEEEEEEEEKVASPPRSKGKGKAPVQEMDQGEVTGVVYDLCEKKGIPYW